MEEDADVFFGCGSDLEAAAVELDAMVVGDPARAAQGEVEVEQGWGRAGAQSAAALALAEEQDVGGDLFGGAVDGGVLAVDFHGQEAVGIVVGPGFGEGEQGDQAALETSGGAWARSTTTRAVERSGSDHGASTRHRTRTPNGSV